MRRHLCGVPKEECTGTGIGANQGLGKFTKCHSSPQEAFECHARWLKKQGYVQIGKKEFAAPNNGPVRVLTRPGKFGAVMRRGKVGEGGQSGSTTRIEPQSVGKGVKSGTIISM